MSSDKPRAQTRVIREAHRRTPEREHSEPIFATSSFIFDSAEEAAKLFNAENHARNVYSRFSNPNTRAFEQRLAALEGGRHAVAFASGMAAITSMLLALLKAGDHIVAAHGLFGATTTLFAKVCARFDISCDFVALTDTAAWENAVRDNTRLLFLESPSNPLCEIADIKGIAQLAKSAGARLAVDNAFCTPVLQRPLALGADLVVHTATKYLDGQGRCIGGAVVTDDSQAHDDLRATLRATGACMSPFNAWVFSKGLETLSLRMRAHSANAMYLAERLVKHPAVTKVYYPGLKDHPQHALARAQFDAPGFGGIVAFSVNGGRADAWRIIDKVKLFSITANLGDAKSTITHPATTTHSRITQAQREAAGIGDNLIRLSVGLESADDLIDDLTQALSSA